jgi:AcrR family transcriptional regulator
MDASNGLTAIGKRRKKTIPPRRNNIPEDTGDRIIAAATRLFATKGYEGTSTKEICQAAGANIAAIHYHFGTKENLYRRIIEQFAEERLESARKTLQAPMNADDMRVRLEIFLSQVVETILKQPDVAILIQRGIEMSNPMSENAFRNNIVKLFERLVEFFVQAKKKGILAAEVDPFIAAGFLRSQFLHQTRYDDVLKKYYGYSLKDEKYRTQWIHQTIRIFLVGVMDNKRAS